jgi:3-methyladenine DNA glycosylase AlkC
MVSPSSKTEIKKRTLSFLDDHFDFQNFDVSQIELLKLFLQHEFDTIPAKERIGKGMVYIVKIVANVLYQSIRTTHFKLKARDLGSQDFIEGVLKLVNALEADPEMLRMAIHLIANLASESFHPTVKKIEQWALNEQWEIQENACHAVMSGLQTQRTQTLQQLRQWAQHPHAQLRRLVAESLRPKAEIKWLRDPTQNAEVLEILTILNHDPSIYVRKSVGNNLKDLTKYIPATILDLIEGWLAKKGMLNEKEQKNLIWTIFHALRWLKARNPEYHDRIKDLIGENYLHYYDEKKNRRALPPK